MALTDLPYAQRAAEIERQRRYAELLQQQAAEPLQSQQVSGIVVPTSPWLGLAKMLQAGLGGYAERKAGEQEAALKKQSAEEAKKYFTDLATYAQKGEKTGETPITTEISGYGATQPLPVLNVQDGKFSQAMKDVYTPATKAGMLARMMEGMSSENPDIAKYASTFGSALMPKEVSATDLFNKLDLSKLTPESAEIVAATGDPTKARFKPEEMTPYQTAELAMREQDNKVRAAEAAVQNAKSEAQLKMAQANLDLAIQGREQSRREFEINYPGASAQGGQAAGRPLDKVSYNAFKEQDAKIDEASGNFTNFRSVLSSISPTQGIVGKQAGELATAFKAAQASIRLLQNTGVLNQGELPFLEETLANPQGFMAIANPTTRAKLEGQLNELDKLVKRKKAALYKQYEQPLPSTMQTTSNNQSASGEPDLSQYYAGFNQNGT